MINLLKRVKENKKLRLEEIAKLEKDTLELTRRINDIERRLMRAKNIPSVDEMMKLSTMKTKRQQNKIKLKQLKH